MQQCILELINIFLLPFAFFLLVKAGDGLVGLNVWLAILLNGLLLLEGSLFWYSVFRNLKGHDLFNRWNLFSFFKTLNLWLFGIVLLVVILNPSAGPYDLGGTIFFLVLAMLEHINYFHFQLMYDNINDLRYLKRFGRLKKAKLGRILEEIKV